MINIQHATPNDMKQMARLCISVQKVALPKRYNLMDCNRLCLQHRKNHLLYLMGLPDGRNTDMSIVSQNNPRKQMC